MSQATVESAEAGSARITQGGLAIAAAVHLGLAATLTAWSAYRGSLTSDLVLKNYSEQQVILTTVNDYFGRADQQEALETSLFLEWAVATATGSTEAADYLATVMGPELYSAVEWWGQQSEETAPATPFSEDNPFYAELPSRVLIAQGESFYVEADALRLAAEEADANSDRFDLANVFFAVVLFIAGLTTIVQRRSIQYGFLALSVAGLLAGIVVLVTTPGWAVIG